MKLVNESKTPMGRQLIFQYGEKNLIPEKRKCKVRPADVSWLHYVKACEQYRLPGETLVSVDISENYIQISFRPEKSCQTQ